MAEQNNNQAAQTAQTAQPSQPTASASAPAAQAPSATPPQAPQTQPAAQQNTQANAPAQSEPAAEPEKKGGDKKPGKAYFTVALVCTALGVLFFGLTFTPLAVYSLLGAILFCIASISFLGAQKKILNFKGVLILKIITYVIFIGLVAFFIGGVIWSMT